MLRPSVRQDEVHVLQQVRHAGLAIAFKARADQVGHVDRHLRAGRIGEQQHAQAVGIVVFGDAADGCLLLHALRQCLRKRRDCHYSRQQDYLHM